MSNKFSLFDLEKLDERELLKVHHNAIGNDEYETRANIALILRDDGMLKDCPLFSDHSNIFFKYLSLSPLKIINELVKISLNTSGGLKIFLQVFEQHRILFVYALCWAELHKKTTNIRLFSVGQFEFYRDEDYLHEIRSLSRTDIKILLNIFSSLTEPRIVHDITRKKAEKEYYTIKSLKKYDLQLLAYLNVIAIERNDVDIIKKFSNFFERQAGNSSPYLYTWIYWLSPNIQTFSQKQNNFIVDTLQATSSVAGMSPYSHIDYETYLELIGYIISKYSGSCDEFFRECFKYITNQKMKRYLLSALMAVCKDYPIMKSLLSKAMNISYVNPSLYT